MRSRLLLLILAAFAPAHAADVEQWLGVKERIGERQQRYVVIEGARYFVQRCHAGTASERYALWAGKPPSFGLKAGRGSDNAQICLEAGDAYSDPVGAHPLAEH